MVRVANWTGLPMGAAMLVGRPVILSKPRSIKVVPGASARGGGGAGGASGAVASAGAAPEFAGAGAGEGAVCATAATMLDAISKTSANGAFMARVPDFAAAWPV